MMLIVQGQSCYRLLQLKTVGSVLNNKHSRPSCHLTVISSKYFSDVGAGFVLRTEPFDEEANN